MEDNFYNNYFPEVLSYISSKTQTQRGKFCNHQKLLNDSIHRIFEFSKLGIVPETVAQLACNYLVNLLHKKDIPGASRLGLIEKVCVSLACKYSQTVHISELNIPPYLVRAVELWVLENLDWKLDIPTPGELVVCMLKLANLTEVNGIVPFCYQIIEKTYKCSVLREFSAPVIAAGSVSLALKELSNRKEQDVWNSFLETKAQISSQELKEFIMIFESSEPQNN